MKGYCNAADVRFALAPTGDREGTAATLPDAQLEDAIAEAEGDIDLHLGTRYSWDIGAEGAPEPVRGWTRTIAAYLATLSYRKNKDLSEDDPIRLRYDRVFKFLEAVRDGKIDLALTIVGVNAAQGVHVENLYEGQLFGFDSVGLAYGPEYTPQVYIPLRRDV